jgi:hypothetical protein
MWAEEGRNLTCASLWYRACWPGSRLTLVSQKSANREITGGVRQGRLTPTLHRWEHINSSLYFFSTFPSCVNLRSGIRREFTKLSVLWRRNVTTYLFIAQDNTIYLNLFGGIYLGERGDKEQGRWEDGDRGTRGCIASIILWAAQKYNQKVQITFYLITVGTCLLAYNTLSGRLFVYLGRSWDLPV